jgi:UDP-glucose 4-epimerase
MPAVIVDITNDLGYAPTVELAEGLARTWQYFQQS